MEGGPRTLQSGPKCDRPDEIFVLGHLKVTLAYGMSVLPTEGEVQGLTTVADAI